LWAIDRRNWHETAEEAVVMVMVMMVMMVVVILHKLNSGCASFCKPSIIRSQHLARIWHWLEQIPIAGRDRNLARSGRGCGVGRSHGRQGRRRTKQAGYLLVHDDLPGMNISVAG
jgi:hypothetical protein